MKLLFDYALIQNLCIHIYVRKTYNIISLLNTYSHTSIISQHPIHISLLPEFSLVRLMWEYYLLSPSRLLSPPSLLSSSVTGNTGSSAGTLFTESSIVNFIRSINAFYNM